jgi:hypothetical protein
MTGLTISLCSGRKQMREFSPQIVKRRHSPSIRMTTSAETSLLRPGCVTIHLFRKDVKYYKANKCCPKFHCSKQQILNSDLLCINENKICNAPGLPFIRNMCRSTGKDVPQISRIFSTLLFPDFLLLLRRFPTQQICFFA